MNGTSRPFYPYCTRSTKKKAGPLALTDEDFPRISAGLRERFASGESLDAMLPEAFALARKAARRRLGERPYDVQVLGAIVLHQGKIVEMKTGEGKTLMSVAAAYLNVFRSPQFSPRKGLFFSQRCKGFDV